MPATGPGQLDLWRAVLLAVETYPSIRDSEALLEQQREAVTEARAGYLPTIQVGMNTGRQGSYGNGQQLSLSASQTLYDFGKVDSSVLGAEAGVRFQQLQLRAEIDEVAQRAAQALIEVDRYRSLRNAAQALLDGVRQLLDLARQRAREGASTQADLAQAQSRVEAAESSLLAISTQLRQQESRLAMLIGEPVPESGVSIARERLQRAALAIVPDMQQVTAVRLAQAEFEVADARLSLARANTRPTVSVDGSVSEYMGNAGDGMDDRVYTLTVGVRHDLFAGGAPSARVRGASQAVLAAEERIQTSKLEAQDEWDALLEQMSGLDSRMRVLAQRQKSIVATQKLYREQYLSLGTRTLLDLLNAEQEIFQAETDSVNATYDLLGAQIAFIGSTGHMHEVFQLTGLSFEGSKP
ncbi:TolC family protein [Pseudomonas sp. Milli4]|uniref:TolC family protein n=2 Tax=Pseudomonas schmalbachii TaxID=2816993 RepID=A0ABS3TM40_9PSED|nr:TolC family protein [Pseudomonas schmalbachii]